MSETVVIEGHLSSVNYSHNDFCGKRSHFNLSMRGTIAGEGAIFKTRNRVRVTIEYLDDEEES